ncbi:hypothetical protein [uncultured Bacteroides sp.]|nr:hypothetical protein [uncultured Bacteroides sp.]
MAVEIVAHEAFHFRELPAMFDSIHIVYYIFICFNNCSFVCSMALW